MKYYDEEKMVEIRKALEKELQKWKGEREARFADPDGYRLAISSPARKSTQ